MSDPANTLDHKVAMSVTGLASSVFDLTLLCNDPVAAAMAGNDHELIVSAHRELGRLLSRLPANQNEAA